MRDRQGWFLSGLFLTTFATLQVEILDTRLLSVITWYHLSFLAVSLAMFGMAAGAVRVYLGEDEFGGDAAPAILGRDAYGVRDPDLPHRESGDPHSNGIHGYGDRRLDLVDVGHRRALLSVRGGRRDGAHAHSRSGRARLRHRPGRRRRATKARAGDRVGGDRSQQ